MIGLPSVSYIQYGVPNKEPSRRFRAALSFNLFARVVIKDKKENPDLGLPHGADDLATAVATHTHLLSQASPASAQDNHGALVLVDEGVVFNGDDQFVVTKTNVHLEKPGRLSREKIALLEKVLRPAHLSKRSILDVSSQPGYFVFAALQNGASSVTVTDTDTTYLNRLEKACRHLGFDNIVSHSVDWMSCDENADVVLALDSQNLLTKSSDEINLAIKKLAELTRYALLIQCPFQFKSNSTDSTATSNFEDVLKRYFTRVQSIGCADDTLFYAAFHSSHDIDLSCPLPDSGLEAKLISCRKLTEFAGLPYWSRVFVGENQIFKQASRELIERERHFLSRLNSQYFPKILEVKECGDSSILVLEKIDGASLEDCQSQITSSLTSFKGFVFECLKILFELQEHGITHRDIQKGNLLIRNSDAKPVLIDFGWAMSDELPMFVPDGLLSLSPDSQACDVYAMGELLKNMAGEIFPQLSSLFDLMTEPDPSVRITNACDLIEIFQLLVSSSQNATQESAGILEPKISQDTAQKHDENRALRASSDLSLKLLRNLNVTRARLSAARRDEVLLKERSKIEKDHRLAVLQMEYQKVVSEIARVIAELERVTKEKDGLLELLDERQQLVQDITQSQAWRLANRLQKSKKSIGQMFKKSP